MEKENNLEKIPCPICGNKALQELSRTGQFGIPCFVSICPSDGLVFLSPRWSKERYMHFYQHEYDAYYRPTILTHETEEEKYNNIKIISSRLEKFNFFEKDKSVLEIGPGMGWSLQWLKNRYPNIKRFAAIESSDNCIANLKNVIGADVISNDIDSDWTNTEFDFIILRHVFEHVMNPIKALKKIEQNLSEDGIVYIAIPDMMNPKGSLKNYWFRAVHTFYFSKMTLLSVAALANLQPLEIKSENSELWGVFQKATNSLQNQNIKNVFEEQIRIIKSHKKKNFFPEIKRRIIQAIMQLFPYKFKSWLVNRYKSSKK